MARMEFQQDVQPNVQIAKKLAVANRQTQYTEHMVVFLFHMTQKLDFMFFSHLNFCRSTFKVQKSVKNLSLYNSHFHSYHECFDCLTCPGKQSSHCQI